MASPVASPAGSLTAVTPSELARPAAEGGRSLARTAVTPSELARPAAEGRRLTRRERGCEPSWRRAASPAEGELHPSKGREGVGRRRDGEAGAVEGGIEECTE